MLGVNLIRQLSLFWFCAFVMGAAYSADDPDIRIPESARTAWISNNINQNGMVLSIRTFQSDQSVDSVFNFYRSAWYAEGEIPGLVENELGDWNIISQLQDDHNIVLQLKGNESGGSNGFLSVARKTHGATAPDLDFPMPAGTETYSSTFLEEDGAEVHTMTFVSTQAVGTTVNFYKDKLKRRGWDLARSDEVDGSKILLFNGRGGNRCEMVVHELKPGVTAIHVNRVKRNG